MSSIFLREKIYLINNHSNKISGSKLPSNLQVLKTLFFNLRVVNLNLRESARLIVREVLIFWEKARIPVRLEKHCISKVESLYDEWRTLQKHAARNTGSHKEQENLFISKFNDLFDLAHANALQMIKIETDRLFLINQRKKGRLGFMYGIDYTNMRKEELSITRKNKALVRENQSAQTEENLMEIDKTSSDLETDDCSSDLGLDESFSSVEIDVDSTSSNRVRGQKNIITSKIVCALDNCKVSDRGAIHIIMAVVEALEKNVDDYVINRTSIQRCRQILRKERASLIKDKFLESDLQAVVLHWDGKLLPNLVGKDIMDRLSIVISSGDIEKILSIPVLQNSTANEQAKVIYKTLIEWNIQNSVRALSFDTTAVNSGRLGGTCVLLERLLKKELFYLPCRHHIYEIILRSIFDKKLNISTGKDVPIFKRFQHSWNKIDKYDFSPGILDEKIKGIINPHLTRVLEFVKEHLKILQPRNDYKELLELTMIFLGDKPNNTIFFHTPGAIHHARWMAKAIYCLKIFMFRTSFELTISEEDGLRDICIFIVTIYIEAWFKAPSAAAAPYQDLLFIRKLYNYSSNDDDISRVALHKFRNHLWYLTPEAVALAFFDKTISNESKRKMIIKLNCKTHSNEKIKRLSLKESEIPEFVKKEIEFFVTSRTLDFFKIFNLDTEFLLNDPSDWSENLSFQNAFKTISKLKTVNDTAERGIKLIEDYNSILTTNEEQKQFVLQIVSDYRKIFPDCKKQTLKRKL
ncbi:hypothetical protein AGLY_009015 [Aphis glycines]|uniref:Uncharacterized protein n=1 Tax=Aphis glycines TaxID=307491 RepID=A0A6G0TJE0_APHGL|nr:hypothetical protein AGLY_009015 [Aphis glycines]